MKGVTKKEFHVVSLNFLNIFCRIFKDIQCKFLVVICNYIEKGINLLI